MFFYEYIRILNNNELNSKNRNKLVYHKYGYRESTLKDTTYAVAGCNSDIHNLRNFNAVHEMKALKFFPAMFHLLRNFK